jgi:hypothetical protein
MNTREVNMLPKLLPRNINEMIHEEVLNTSRWKIVTNNQPIDKFQFAHNKADSGMILCSYEAKDIVEHFPQTDNNDPSFQKLNFFAEMILDLALQRCRVKTDFDSWPVFSEVKVLRYFWNYYHRDSIGTWHTDKDDDENAYSLIYYINDAENCGTQIIENNGAREEEVMVDQVAGDAVLFPSSFKHAGTSANSGKHRCNLNILFTAREIKNFTQPIKLGELNE